ncbi:MAG: electron transfer flavoprotein subunit alpha/FixB family protein [Defluviitaleaceae bacterium]|nr:electron transfer flavoprotein subunit alpha/FixB family protein [Defluviitaleaceae bacterium]
MGKDILVFCEQRDGVLQKVSLELIGKGRELADNQGGGLVALLLGSGIAGLAQTLINHGADHVIYVDDAILADYMTEPYTKAAAAVIKDTNPDIVLIGATSIGRDLAPRIAARIETGLTADCTSLVIDEETGEFWMTRPAFGGNIMATIICPEHRPQMATVRPGVMVALDEKPRTGEINKFHVKFDVADANVEILQTVMATKKTKDITEAKVLVSGGRGVGKSENFAPLKELADLLGGQISASRASVDAGYAEKDRQVGQTGKTVRPDVYFACGISGAIQHVAGMEESELIIAINKNPEAPIFEVADVGIVGDMHKILPKLVAQLRRGGL